MKLKEIIQVLKDEEKKSSAPEEFSSYLSSSKKLIEEVIERPTLKVPFEGTIAINE